MSDDEAPAPDPTGKAPDPDESVAARRARVEAERVDVHIPEGLHRGQPMTLPQRALYRFVWLVVQAIGRGYFRVSVSGRHHVPESGAYIVSPIHRSNLDTPIIAVITRRRLRYMGKESLWKTPASGWFFSVMGGFPVQRGSADREALKACIEVAERGEPLVMFPEGTRQSGPEIQALFDGPAYVAAKAQVPILPIGIGGTERAMGKGAKLPRPSKIQLVIGPPIPPPAPSPGGRVPRKAVRELTATLSERIQVLFDDAQARLGHPNKR